MLEGVGAIVVRRIPRTPSGRRPRPGAGAGRAGAAARGPAPGGDVGDARRRAAGALPRCAAPESSAGRSYPVTLAHFPARRDETLERAGCGAASNEALAKHPGRRAGVPARPARDRARRTRAGDAARRRWQRRRVLPLHGELPLEQQSEALRPIPQGRRRVVLATNVAESSVTLPGVRVVIDSGLAREPRYDPNSGFSRLEIVNISQASADQRAGRAGRVAEGWRLSPVAAIAAAGAAAHAGDRPGRTGRARAGTGGLGQRRAALRRSRRRPARWRRRANCCSARRARGRSARSPRSGRRMLALGTHPRLAAMLLSAPAAQTTRALACDLAALVEARDPLRGRAATSWPRAGRRWRRSAQGRAAGRREPCRAWRRSTRRARNGAAACAATPRRRAEVAGARARRPARARLPRPHRAPASRRPAPLPAGQRPHGATVRRQRALRRALARGQRIALRGHAMRWCCARAPVDEARLRARFPERFVERRRGALGCRRARAASPPRNALRPHRARVASPAGRVDPAQAAQALSDAVARARPGRRCRGASAAAMARARALPARVDAGTRPARPVRRRLAGHAATTGCSRPSPARPGSTRSARTSWPRR